MKILESSVKIIATDKQTNERIEVTDLYWFEENGIHDWSGDGTYGQFNFEIIVDGERFERAKNEAVETLSDYAHGAWSGWMKYMFSRSTINPDGTCTIPAGLVQRWQRQMNTLYADLPETEKKSDRDEAIMILSRLGMT